MSQVFDKKLMTCIVCGREEMSHPEAPSNWRCLEMDNKFFYACPDEFPPDHSGKERFQVAYQLVIACCVNEMLRESGGNLTVEVEEYRLKRTAERLSKRTPRGFG